MGPFLPVCLHKPEPLVDRSGDFRQDVRRVIVPQLIHLLDRSPDSGPKGGQSRRERFYVLLAAGRAGRVVNSVLRAATLRAVPCAMPPS